MTVEVRTEEGEQVETVTASFPHEESERGFLTLLRQFANEGEGASFKRLEKLAMESARENGGTNEPILRSWGRVHKKLLTRTSYDWARRKIFDLEAATGWRYPHTMRVDQLLRTYYYGDVIHFGEGRDDLEALQPDAFSDASNRMTLYKGASGLASYYMGYATLLEQVHSPPVSVG